MKQGVLWCTLQVLRYFYNIRCGGVVLRISIRRTEKFSWQRTDECDFHQAGERKIGLQQPEKHKPAVRRVL